LPPSGNLVLVALGKDESGDRTPFPLFDDLLLDLGRRSAIEAMVSGRLGVGIDGLARVDRSPIASRAGGLSPSNRLPFNFR
jgi:hypothetical protein